MGKQNRTIITNAALVSGRINNVLSITGALEPYLLDPDASFGDGGFKKSNPLDGGAKMAVEQTLIRACNRLDTIIQDDKNWIDDEMDDAMKFARELRDHQRKDFKAKLGHAARLSPSIMRIDDLFVVFIGDPNVPATLLCGVGVTPVAAIEDFDRIMESPENQHHKIPPGAFQRAVPVTTTEPAAPPEEPKPTKKNGKQRKK